MGREESFGEIELGQLLGLLRPAQPNWLEAAKNLSRIERVERAYDEPGPSQRPNLVRDLGEQLISER